MASGRRGIRDRSRELKLGHILCRSDWHTEGSVVSATLREIGGVYCVEFLSTAEEVRVLMAGTALSPSSPVIIVI
jgi:hypothetical protein